MRKLQHQSSLLKQGHIIDSSSLNDSNIKKQHSYANMDHNLPIEEYIMLDFKVVEDILIINDSTSTLINDKEYPRF